MVLRLTPHGRLDRQPPVSVDERVSLTTVVEAIADIMGDHNRFGIVDRTLAARIGREVQTAVAAAVGTGRISSAAQLTGQQAFWSILTQHLATTSSAHTDQQARQALLDHIRFHSNMTGADFANFVAQFRRGGGYADRAGDRDGGSALLTSARFDGFSGADAALLSAMRRSAIDAGLHWAADRPEILRMLGHEGIRALRDAQFTRESFQALRQAGFSERDAARVAVGISRYATRHGLDANEIAGQVGQAPGILGGGNAAAEQEWRDRFTRFFDNPQDEEARRDMGRALGEAEARGTPQQREFIERMRPLLKLEAETTLQLGATNAEDAARLEAAARAEREAAERAEAARIAGARADTATADDAYGPGPAVVTRQPHRTPLVAAPATLQPTQHVAGPR